ncbi:MULTISPECIES: TetR/AcrR family transcriptional regulator [Paenibacillus]|uniref:Transcriptional regulator, TetR family n=2 Tax=Paenibacillus lactis TaxID=228574 RepID=G4HN00_9BACL|nr:MULTISPECIES: TetR/AcrR family transcriptional regulator [Paenibacillus]EHB54365.1 transcriptional regulator, TetR family [Paenibacillus lactis 154]MBP1891622.1 AcrR family transcriptional regulator [Paenibacillus lactis]MCM3494085.1 TetR/AcrR family transcriptional regulator [Paenibacillus lactis]GIO88864.1 TetR family transcriptional regulator [Paenibacillus lactis]HAG00374.1 TetR/AcrR family transcriptional regulator [Paenibacillus lactis]
MARNKYPEETINQILTVALNLFMQKGYEQTSIQDIINELGGLTKGAIYHHFKSKEEIWQAVIDHAFKGVDEMLSGIRDDKGLNGLEKLRKISQASLDNAASNELASVGPNLLRNPKLLAAQIENILEKAVPVYIQPIIEQGMRDGSIRTDYPRELSEVLVILTNIWLNPEVIEASPEMMLHKVRFFDEILKGLGLDLFDEQMYQRYEELFRVSAREVSKEN